MPKHTLITHPAPQLYLFAVLFPGKKKESLCCQINVHFNAVTIPIIVITYILMINVFPIYLFFSHILYN